MPEAQEAAADYVRRWARGEMKPEMTVGERVHDAFVSGVKWAAGFRRAPVEPAEPAVTEPVLVTIAARRAGKTQALIENLLAQANEHGIHVKVEYGNAVTDAQVLVALNAWYAKEREQNGWPIGSNATELADYSPQAQDRMRAALRAALATRGADDEQ